MPDPSTYISAFHYAKLNYTHATIFDRCYTPYEHRVFDLDNPSFYALTQCVMGAQEAASKISRDDRVRWFLILAGSLVFSLQVGFAMLCAGSVRLKNAQHTMLKNLLDACCTAMAFFICGYGIAFGRNEWIGENKYVGGAKDAEQVDYATWFYHFACASSTVTIVAGALAERCQMFAYVVFSFVLSGFVYPLVVHLFWNHEGFLSPFKNDPVWGVGAIDFAGSGVVHMTGGLAALIAAKILGPRRGRFYHVRTGEVLEEPKEFPGHSVALQLFGSFLLWFGCELFCGVVFLSIVCLLCFSYLPACLHTSLTPTFSLKFHRVRL